MFRRILGLGCLILLAGCGGDNGGPVTPVAAFRSNVPGDQWVYNVQTINFGIFGSYSGSLTEGITNDTFNNAPSIRFTRTFNLKLQTGPATISSYEELSPQGALLAEQDATGLSDVVSDTFSVPSSLSLTTATSGVISLADGTTYTISYKVVGTERVITPVGAFACWVVTENVVHSDTTTDAYRICIAPETGNYVQITDTTVNPDESSYQYTATLFSIVTPNSTGVRPAISLPPLSMHN